MINLKIQKFNPQKTVLLTMVFRHNNYGRKTLKNSGDQKWVIKYLIFILYRHKHISKKRWITKNGL